MSFIIASKSKENLLPEGVLQEVKTIVNGRSTPSKDALSSYQADLQQEVHNISFRLRFLFNQYQSHLSLIADVKKQLGSLN